MTQLEEDFWRHVDTNPQLDAAQKAIAYSAIRWMEGIDPIVQTNQFWEPERKYENAIRQKLAEALVSDEVLRELHAERVKICSITTPAMLMDRRGNVTLTWVDEAGIPNLQKIDEMIEHRIKQIRDFYSARL